MLKGVFIRNLAKLQAVVQKEVFRAPILRNAGSVWENDRNSRGQFGQDWSSFAEPVYSTSLEWDGCFDCGCCGMLKAVGDGRGCIVGG